VATVFVVAAILNESRVLLWISRTELLRMLTVSEDASENHMIEQMCTV